MLINGHQKLPLFVVFIAALFCASLVLSTTAHSATAQAKQPAENIPYLVIDAQEEAWDLMNEGYEQGNIMDFLSTFTMLKSGNTTFDLLKGHGEEKQYFSFLRDKIMENWSIAPLMSTNTNYPMAIDIRYGVILKFWF